MLICTYNWKLNVCHVNHKNVENETESEEKLVSLTSYVFLYEFLHIFEVCSINFFMAKLICWNFYKNIGNFRPGGANCYMIDSHIS